MWSRSPNKAREYSWQSSLLTIGRRALHVGALTVALLSAPSRATDDATTPPAGLSTPDWTSFRSAFDASRHSIAMTDGEYRARNPGQRWATAFDGRGFMTIPDAKNWSWGLELESYGWGEERKCVPGSASVIENGNRFAYVWDEVISEWYVNDTRGLEHGFTLEGRPNTASGPLTLLLTVRGDLEAAISASGRDIRFLRDGARVVDYAGLVVIDAKGDEVPARFDSLSDGRLRLTVDDGDASYPLTIDPVAQQAYLKASNTQANDFFSWSVDISGDTIVVGAPEEDSNATGINGDQANNSAPNAGAAYVFVRNGTTWTQQAYLKASNTGSNDKFGESVAIEGDTLVVGARLEDSSATGVNGNQADNGTSDSGAAYVFVRSGTTWTQQAYLKASNPGLTDEFGYSVAIEADTIVVGAVKEDSNASGINGNQASNSASESGAAYVFVRSGTTWTQQAYVKASNTGSSDWFGYRVAISGDTFVAGTYRESSDATGINGNQANDNAHWAGAAYVFVRNGTSWSQQAYLKASNAEANDNFGVSVDIFGDTIAVGANGERSNATGVNGNQADNSISSAGAAYIFVRNGTTWTQQAYLKASNTGPDWFGRAVGISGDKLIVGAAFESSSATGVNGNQADDSLSASGAAYFFVRSGTTWTQHAYLKAASPDVGDLFGITIALSGDTAMVGLYSEDSNATGVDGNSVNNGAADSGAVYVFDLVGCTTPAAATSYGSGKAGSFGVPTLSSTNLPILNSTSDLTIRGGLPGAAPVLLFAGFAPAALPFDGGALLVNPTFVVTLPGLDGSGGFVLPIPLTASTCGLHVYFQAMFIDPGASGFNHTAQTNGLDWTIGS